MSTIMRLSPLLIVFPLLLVCLASPFAFSARHVQAQKLTAKSPQCSRVRRETLILTRGTLWSDGNPLINAVLVNGTSPGPTLRFRAGDVVLVKVVNAMANDNATIHFHGLSQTLSPTSDGTPMVSQWPIAPGNYFEYEMHLRDEDVGTTFYHSHVNLQSMTALGPLVVEDRLAVPYTIPRGVKDKIMAVGDYFYEGEADIRAGLHAIPFKWPGSAKAILLNGAAWSAPDACNATIAESVGVQCAQSTYNGPAIVDVEYDSVYRLRWVGATTLMHLAVAIFNHSQTIVAADGTYMHPVQTDHVELMSGQRYDSLLKTKSKAQVEREGMHGCYYIRMETRWRLPRTNGWALLRYPHAQCNVSMHTAYPMNNTAGYLSGEKFGWISEQFHPLSGYEPVGEAPSDRAVTRRMYLFAQQTPVDGVMPNVTGVQWSVDGNSYFENREVLQSGARLDVPYLIALYRNMTVAPSYQRAMQAGGQSQRGYDPTAEVFVARAGEVIDVVIINNASAVNRQTETHPWHFHSQDHWTMAMGVGDFSEGAFRTARKRFGRPISRDTTGVWPGYGASDNVPPQLLPLNTSGAWSVLRFKVPQNGDATGVWLLHCHWAFHQAMGMATVWAFVPQSGDSLPLSSPRYTDPSYMQFNRNVTAPCGSNLPLAL